MHRIEILELKSIMTDVYNNGLLLILKKEGILPWNNTDEVEDLRTLCSVKLDSHVKKYDGVVNGIFLNSAKLILTKSRMVVIGDWGMEIKGRLKLKYNLVSRESG